VATQRTANPRTPVRIRSWPPSLAFRTKHLGALAASIIRVRCARNCARGLVEVLGSEGRVGALSDGHRPVPKEARYNVDIDAAPEYPGAGGAAKVMPPKVLNAAARLLQPPVSGPQFP
jgi:hypothetical protein